MKNIELNVSFHERYKNGFYDITPFYVASTKDYDNIKQGIDSIHSLMEHDYQEKDFEYFNFGYGLNEKNLDKIMSNHNYVIRHKNGGK